MRRIARYVEDRVRSRYPSLYISLFQRPRAHLRLRNERLVIKGADISSSDHPSFIFFTVHRCASTYVSRILRTLAEDAGMVHVNLARYFVLTGVPRSTLFSDTGSLQKAFKKRGYFYGPLRWLHEIPDMGSYPVLLVLRDPRDVMTSHYYSTAYSHALSSREMVARREAAQQETPDEYVLRERHWFKGTYEDYCRELLGRPNVLTLRYEDMLTDFEAWLRQAARHLALDANELLLRRIMDESDFGVIKENAFSHKRQVSPGDHRRKLQPETIKILTAEFRDVLDMLGYPAE